jgi:hypothetical protein
MRLGPETIKLGEKEFLIRPLTLRQVENIEPILLASVNSPNGTVAPAIAVVSIAMARDHPEAAASLADIEATAKEIREAMEIVLRLGGYVEMTVGEEAAAEAAA